MIKKTALQALGALVFAAACGASTACDQTLGDYIVIPGFSGFELSNVRAANVSSDIGTVDLWNRAYPYFPNLGLGDSTDYTTINDGVRTIRAVVAGSADDSNPLVEMQLKFPIDTHHTMLLVGTAGQYELLRFDDDRTPPAADTIRCRVINAIEGGPSLRVFGPNDEALSGAIAYKQATGSVEYAGDVSSLGIRRTDTNAVVWSGAPLPQGDVVVPGESYTIVVYSDSEGMIRVLILINNLAAS